MFITYLRDGGPNNWHHPRPKSECTLQGLVSGVNPPELSLAEYLVIELSSHEELDKVGFVRVCLNKMSSHTTYIV